jgi:hypothetical protein
LLDFIRCWPLNLWVYPSIRHKREPWQFSRYSAGLWAGRSVFLGTTAGGGWEFFSSPLRPERPWGPPSLLSNGYKGFFPWGKAAGDEADHSPPSSAVVKNEWSYTSTPQYVFMAWCLVKHRDNFTFYLYEIQKAARQIP